MGRMTQAWVNRYVGERTLFSNKNILLPLDHKMQQTLQNTSTPGLPCSTQPLPVGPLGGLGLTITKLTKDTAFRLIPQSHMTPNMLMRIMAMVPHMITVAHSSQPRRTKVTKKMAPRDTLRLKMVSSMMVRYCS